MSRTPMPRVNRRHRVADEAAVRERPVGGVPDATRGRRAPPANPTTFTGPDTNSTALAVQGLAAWGKFPRQSVGAQLADGRASRATPASRSSRRKGQASDPDSTALVIQALLAEKSAPSSATWKKGANTPYTALGELPARLHEPRLRRVHLPRSTAANVFATVQSVPAMAGKKLPVASSTASVVLG